MIGFSSFTCKYCVNCQLRCYLFLHGNLRPWSPTFRVKCNMSWDSIAAIVTNEISWLTCTRWFSRHICCSISRSLITNLYTTGFHTYLQSYCQLLCSSSIALSESWVTLHCKAKFGVFWLRNHCNTCQRKNPVGLLCIMIYKANCPQ